jgi:protein-L-isoaspartate(D-aspartate) O-methyltransferase
MTELLEPAEAQHVLEVGTGSGCQAAILAQLVSWVDTIEIVPELVRLARRTLHKLRYANVTVHEGNGYLGLPERAPFDRIIVTAAPPLIPRTLIDQLEAGGRLVAPVGATWSQEGDLCTDGEISRLGRSRVSAAVRWVPTHRPRQQCGSSSELGP